MPLQGFAGTDVRNVVGCLSGASGVAAILAPFIAGISPFRAMQLGLEGEGLVVFSLGAATLLAIPIAIWQIRRVFVPVPASFEVALAYPLATLAMFPVLLVSVPELSGAERVGSPVGFVALLVAWCAMIGNVGLLVRNGRRGTPSGVAAEVFLLLGYLPNALYALTVFSYTEFFGFGPRWLWDVGAYVVLVTCVLYAVQAGTLLRRSARTGESAE